MITSQLILDTFNLIFDGHKSRELLDKQINYLSIGKLDHTGVGLFIHFTKDTNIYSYKINEESGSKTTDNQGLNEPLIGIELKNKDLNILADVIVHIKDGIIDNLEIFQKYHSSYPMTEPEHYEIYQDCLDKSKRRTITR
jgi:hypothetical protein